MNERNFRDRTQRWSEGDEGHRICHCATASHRCSGHAGGLGKVWNWVTYLLSEAGSALVEPCLRCGCVKCIVYMLHFLQIMNSERTSGSVLTCEIKQFHITNCEQLSTFKRWPLTPPPCVFETHFCNSIASIIKRIQFYQREFGRYRKTYPLVYF